jgi:hypothetical protein
MTQKALLLWTAATLIHAQTPTGKNNAVPTLTVCQALVSAGTYDGQVVRLRDTKSETSEGGWLEGTSCPGAVVTDGFVWPSVVFLQTSRAGVFRLHKSEITYDLASEERASQKYARLKARLPDRCIRWTYIGMFETRQDWSQSKLTYADGTSKFAGFGHLGYAPAQIIVRSVEDVEQIANCNTTDRGK